MFSFFSNINQNTEEKNIMKNHQKDDADSLSWRESLIRELFMYSNEKSSN